MWAYDIQEKDWSPIPVKSSVLPLARSDFSHARYQDDFIIFGGKVDTELINDIAVFSTRDREWRIIDVETTKPSARRAACMAAADDFIVIYGGITANGYSNELWKFEWATKSYTLLDSSNFTPKSAFSQCHIDWDSDGDKIFKVYLGETEGESPLAFVYEYNLHLNKWSVILEASINDTIGKSKSAIFMIQDEIIVAGGSTWSYGAFKSIYILTGNFEERIDIGVLPTPVFYGASAYYKNKIYIHGGGGSFDELPLKSKVKNDLIAIQLNEKCDSSDDFCISKCSKGTYYKHGECHLCAKGSYSDRIGSEKCDLCMAGYFSDIIGAETLKACKPCSYGYFNTQEGQSICMKCPAGSICSLNEVQNDNSSEIIRYTSKQPELLDYYTESVSESSKNCYFIIGILLMISIVPLLVSKRARYFIKKVDIYSKHHNYKEGKPMTIKKTLIGGIFTTAFIFSGLGIIFNMLLSYGLDNIREIKGLVPLVALEQPYINVIFIQFAAEEASFHFELKSYSGTCGNEEGICTNDLDINIENIKGFKEEPICRKVNSDCYLNLRIRNFELIENGKMSIKLSEILSLCSSIYLKVETSSSIPGEVSSISDIIWSDKNQSFRGSIPSTFSYLMTPSLFKTDSSIWEDDQKGYHISVQEDPVKGSQASNKEYFLYSIIYSNHLQVEVLLYKNWAVLYTQRLQVYPISTLLSNLSGSLVGVLGVLGFIMRYIERICLSFPMRRSKKRDLRTLYKKRQQLLCKNFALTQGPNMKSPQNEMNWTFDWFRHRLNLKVHDSYSLNYTQQ
jgi:hypothetical protein